MNILDKINDLFIKGWITEEEYEELYNKYAPSYKEKIIELISSMSIEELLDTYKNDDTNVIKYLIIAELENRIEK